MLRIIQAAMQRSVLVIVSVLLIMVWGGISAWGMQRDYLPPINNSALMITLQAGNYQADQVKDKISPVIENGIKGINGLANVETRSYNGGFLCSLYFPLDYDMDKAETEVTQAVSNLQLPAGIGKPLVTKVSTSSFPIMRLNLTSQSGQEPEGELRTAVQNKVAAELKNVPGVGEVRVTGGGNSGYVVTLRMDELQKQGVSVEDVKRSLAALNPAWPDASVTSSQLSIPVQFHGTNTDAKDLQTVTIQTADGKQIPLASIANIEHTSVNLQTIARTDGKPSVMLDVLKTPSSNITQVSDRIHQRLHNLQGSINNEYSLSVIYDRGQDVKDSVNSLIKEGLLGCLFAMVSVFVFLRNVRSTALIAISLPVCLLATTAFLKTIGVTLNILTVSGLIVAMGRVVDDSIVLLDNMYRKVQAERGNFKLQQLLDAVGEMIPAIVSSTATTMAVFVPIVFVGGYVSSSFSAFAWTVVTALLVSLAVALFVIPTLFLLVGPRSVSKPSQTVEPVLNRILQSALKHKKRVVGGSICVLLAAGAGVAYLPVNLLPASGPGQISIKVELPEGNSLQEMDGEVKQVERLLQSETKVAGFSATLGSSLIPQFDDVFDEGGGWMQENSIANMSVTVKPNVDVDSFIPELRNKLATLKGKAICTVTNRNISGDDSKLKVVLTGADRSTLNDTARLIRGKLQLVPGLSVEGANESEPRFKINVDGDQLQRLGVQPDDVISAIERYQTQGNRIAVTINHTAVPVFLNTDKVKTASASASARTDLLALLGDETFAAKDGKRVPLKEFASLVESQMLPDILDKDGQPFAVVSADIISRDVGKVTSQTKNVLEGLSLPAGVTYSFGGISEQVQHMIVEMAIALAISTLLVLMIVSAVFRGWKAPLSVLICIPFSIIGSVAAMILFRQDWNLAALIGMMMLIGIVVTNGIVLVDKMERNRRQGMELREAVLSGTQSRVRPVLMTACTTILTLIPLAVSSHADTVISQTLGIVVVGGMLSSTIISLVVIPVIYEWMHSETTVSAVKKESVPHKEEHPFHKL